MAGLVAGLPGFAVAALAGDLSETFNQAELLAPDLVVIAEDFTRLEEFAVMEVLFRALGTGWVLLSEAAHGSGGSGPVVDLSQPPEQWQRILRAARAAPRPVALASAPEANIVRPAQARPYDKIVVIGSSTGGVDALLTLLSAFPANCPPTAIVQHTGRGFSESLVQLLRRRCKPEVVVAQDGMALQAGRIHLAAGIEAHLTLGAGTPPRCQVRPGPLVSGHLPSIDMLFRSALPLAPRVVGVILTGMGQDGAGGLLDLRRAGAVTLGQDEATSVVYGMPKVAWDRGAVQMQLPIQRIGDEILRQAQPQQTADRRLATR